MSVYKLSEFHPQSGLTGGRATNIISSEYLAFIINCMRFLIEQRLSTFGKCISSRCFSPETNLSSKLIRSKKQLSKLGYPCGFSVKICHIIP